MSDTAATDPAIEAVLDFERRRFAAMCAGDVETLEVFMRDGMTYTHSSGIIDTKESYIRGVREKLWDYRQIRPSRQRVTLIGDTALVLARLEIDVVIAGAPKQVDSTALTVLVRENGDWRAAAIHSTKFAEG